MTITLEVGTQKAMPANFPINLDMILPTMLAASLGAGIMFWVVPRCPASFPDGPSKVFCQWWHGLWCIHDVEVILDDFCQEGKAGGGAGGITNNFEDVVILLMVQRTVLRLETPKICGHWKCRDDDPFDFTLQVGSRPSGFHNMFSTSIILFDMGTIFWKTEMVFPLLTSFRFSLSFDYAIEVAMC